MSEISLVGVGGFLAALGTTLLGLLGAFMALILAVARSEGARGRRVVRYCTGPLVCAAVGTISWFAVQAMSGEDSERMAPVVLLTGIACWVGVALAMRRAIPDTERRGGDGRQEHGRRRPKRW